MELYNIQQIFFGMLFNEFVKIKNARCLKKRQPQKLRNQKNQYTLRYSSALLKTFTYVCVSPNVTYCTLGYCQSCRKSAIYPGLKVMMEYSIDLRKSSGSASSLCLPDEFERSELHSWTFVFTLLSISTRLRRLW